MKINFLNKKAIFELIFIVLGSFIISVGVNMFLGNAELLSGGVTGVALILEKLTGIQVGYLSLLMNIPLFICCVFKLNKKFTTYSLVGILSLSFSLIVTKSFTHLITIDDKLLLCLYGGVLTGLGSGIVLLNHGSTGGFDIITMLIKEKNPNKSLSTISFSINSLIVIIGSFIFGISNALYTLISMYITSFVLDKVLQGFNSSKLAFIITDNEDQLTKYIIKSLNRGVTKISGKGVYTNEEKAILFCVLPNTQIPDLKNIIEEHDPSAFLTISDANEIIGKGFKQKL